VLADWHRCPLAHQARRKRQIITGFDIARAMVLGADWCNTARGFMFSLVARLHTVAELPHR